MMVQKNKKENNFEGRRCFRCPNCGFAVYAQDFQRYCAKCDSKMEIEVENEN